MLAFEVALLQGVYDAADPSDRDQPEWPPHPARLFAALVNGAAIASATRTGIDGVIIDGELRAALQWLEQQPPPVVEASVADRCPGPGFYVPVADEYAPATRSRQAHLPGWPNRQRRTFARSIPTIPIIRFIWSDADPNQHIADALVLSARSVACLGRSTSMASVALRREATDRSGLERYEPVGPTRPRLHEQVVRLRVPHAGLLEALEARHRDRGIALPERLVAYHRQVPSGGEPPPQASATGPFRHDLLVVLRRVAGPHVPAELTARVTGALRDALLGRVGDPPPPILLGRDQGGGDVPHCACLALPDVAGAHSDGHLLGVAIALPRTADEQALSPVARALLGDRGDQPLDSLEIPRLGTWRLQRVFAAADGPADTPRGLAPRRWVGPARTWRSVTPVALGRFPRRARFEQDAARIVAEACDIAGYPQPVQVGITRAGMLQGVPAARAFHLPQHASGPPRLTVHVQLEFPCELVGPVLLGPWRFLGMGLCLPLPAAPTTQGAADAS
jgi:CRISPR-associated protein Csb2